MEYTQLTSAGGVVFRYTTGNPVFLLLGFKKRKIWCLPKGIIEKGESEFDTAKREVEEETGISDLKYIDNIDSIRYEFWIKGKRYHKQVYFFLFQTNQENAKVSLEHDVCAWFNFEEAINKLTYFKEQSILKNGYKIIQSKTISKGDL